MLEEKEQSTAKGASKDKGKCKNSSKTKPPEYKIPEPLLPHNLEGSIWTLEKFFQQAETNKTLVMMLSFYLHHFLETRGKFVHHQ